MNLKSNGIGLSYCKRVAKSLGGDLILNETVRDGCEFTLHLKLKKSDSPVKVNNFIFNVFRIKKSKAVVIIGNSARNLSKTSRFKLLSLKKLMKFLNWMSLFHYHRKRNLRKFLMKKSRNL